MRTFCGCTTPVPCAERPPRPRLSAPSPQCLRCARSCQLVQAAHPARGALQRARALAGAAGCLAALQLRRCAIQQVIDEAAKPAGGGLPPGTPVSPLVRAPPAACSRPSACTSGAACASGASGRHLRPAAAPARAPLVLPARRAPASSWLRTSGNCRGSPRLDTRACAWPPQSLCCMARPRQGTGGHPCAGALAAATEPASWGLHRSLEHEGGDSGWSQKGGSDGSAELCRSQGLLKPVGGATPN